MGGFVLGLACEELVISDLVDLIPVVPVARFLAGAGRLAVVLVAPRF